MTLKDITHEELKPLLDNAIKELWPDIETTTLGGRGDTSFIYVITPKKQ